MKWLRSFVLFWYDFIVGDDWRVAVGVAVTLAVTVGLVHSGVNAWWLLPLVVAALLGASLRRVVTGSRHQGQG
ncbi:hypothetical protein NGB36_24075 [Streptomyces sp. RB6PN25]|uniref:Integral membrane protein n=1 Tax=Streptomyces humicola TaxID=2953240 RepID=A0ABT1Q0Y7_9ACTN|nr:hypothetical protein [Streptomyces humicola]MCQ4083591.1 hypothetical protein [Streptomyces humicola]